MPFVALLAFQLVTDPGLPAAFTGHPRAVHPGRVMTHVLVVATGEPSNPVRVLVGMKTDNRLLHRLH